jgi:hypothetical protein
MKKVAIITSNHRHYNHVLKILQPANMQCEFHHVRDRHSARSIAFDYSIAYCNSMWNSTLWGDWQEVRQMVVRHGGKLTTIDDIREPFDVAVKLN